MDEYNQISCHTTGFHKHDLPEPDSRPVGYGALVRALELKVPLPETLCAIGTKHTHYHKNQWRVYSPRYMPEDSVYGHLLFALKYEGVHLLVLKFLFKKIDKEYLVKTLQKEPAGRYCRMIWFLYEWLMDEELPLPDIKIGNYVKIVNEDIQYPGASKLSKRHRVDNNLPGNRNFCPMIRRTEKLDGMIKTDFQNKIQEITQPVRTDLLSRAATFLLLKDSKASYVIEGETPSHKRLERWGQAISQAGLHPLNLSEFERLQRIIIEKESSIHLGYRIQGGFIGIHERDTNYPIPDHISAKHQDILELMTGLLSYHDAIMNDPTYHPVIAATAISFGFIFIHPFEDGNGRLHRYLIHHILSEKNFAPRGGVFPITAAILSKIDEYKRVLESYSRPLLPFIKWVPMPSGNLKVTNETIDYYRYFDATQQAEFLFECIEETVMNILPQEITYLQNYDRLATLIRDQVDIPERLVSLMINFLRQNRGVFSKRSQEREFSKIPLDKIKQIERDYWTIFGA